jgi:ADP-ribose pyrophosphatase YjhB (NUDIX family)
VVTAVLDWARRLQALAQSGLAYDGVSAYDRGRYEEARRIAAEMLAEPDGFSAEELEGLFSEQVGHATPKLDIRGAVFRDDEILLVQERADGNRWTLPGGWVDVGESPSDAVVREVREESGYETRAVRLLALYDREKHAHPPHAWHTWKVFFLCELVSEEQGDTDHEVGEVGFFPLDSLPELSVSRVTGAQIERFFELRGSPERPTEFD